MAVGRPGAEHPWRARRLSAIAVCIALLAATRAQADAPPPTETNHPVAAVLVITGLLVLPTDIGVFIQGDNPDFMLGWSFQFPFTPNDRHRVLVGLDWIPTAAEHHARARAGYRYARGHLIAGLTAASTRGDPTWSPEVGFRIGQDRHGTLHLLARAEIAMAVDGFRGVALLAGWGAL